MKIVLGNAARSCPKAHLGRGRSSAVSAGGCKRQTRHNGPYPNHVVLPVTHAMPQVHNWVVLKAGAGKGAERVTTDHDLSIINGDGWLLASHQRLDSTDTADATRRSTPSAIERPMAGTRPSLCRSGLMTFASGPAGRSEIIDQFADVVEKWVSELAQAAKLQNGLPAVMHGRGDSACVVAFIWTSPYFD